MTRIGISFTLLTCKQILEDPVGGIDDVPALQRRLLELHFREQWRTEQEVCALVTVSTNQIARACHAWTRCLYSSEFSSNGSSKIHRFSVASAANYCGVFTTRTLHWKRCLRARGCTIVSWAGPTTC